jgi:hypothetical protein
MTYLLLRAILTFGVILFSHKLYPIVLDFTQQIVTFEGNLFGFIPLTIIDTQLVQGFVFLFLCLWLWVYANGFVEELQIAQFRAHGDIANCASRWLIAMVLWSLFILAEPVLVYTALDASPLPRWLVWIIVTLFFFFSIGFGLQYPNRVVNHLRRTHGLKEVLHALEK